MAKTTIAKSIFTKKTGDYTFTIMFFLIFSMFIVFAIKPSLTTAASLKKEEADLEKIDAVYEKKIIAIATIQQTMEANRNDFFLLGQAISSYPKVNKMIEDIKSVADQNSFTIQKAGVDDVNLFDTKNKDIQKILVTVEGTSSFDNTMKFTQALFSQRRLKTIPKMTINHSAESSDSAKLKVTLIIEGYYL